MRRFILFITILAIFSNCAKHDDNKESINFEKKTQIMETCISMSYNHSDYLKLEHISNDEFIAKSLLRFDQDLLTKSNNANALFSLGSTLINTIDAVLRDSPNINIKDYIRDYLLENYSYCSDEDFTILAITASTYADSIEYWKDNIYLWLKSEDVNTKSWDRFWGYVKQFACAEMQQLA